MHGLSYTTFLTRERTIEILQREKSSVRHCDTSSGCHSARLDPGRHSRVALAVRSWVVLPQGQGIDAILATGSSGHATTKESIINVSSTGHRSETGMGLRYKYTFEVTTYYHHHLCRCQLVGFQP